MDLSPREKNPIAFNGGQVHLRSSAVQLRKPKTAGKYDSSRLVMLRDVIFSL